MSFIFLWAAAVAATRLGGNSHVSEMPNESAVRSGVSRDKQERNLVY
jgi:hypothetical protein